MIVYTTTPICAAVRLAVQNGRPDNWRTYLRGPLFASYTRHAPTIMYSSTFAAREAMITRLRVKGRYMRKELGMPGFHKSIWAGEVFAEDMTCADR